MGFKDMSEKCKFQDPGAIYSATSTVVHWFDRELLWKDRVDRSKFIWLK
jgi:hypothetical protein